MNTHAPPVRLTEPQRTVLEMLAEGIHLEEVARRRECTIKEAFDLLASATDKLGAKTTYGAIALAIRGGHIL